MGTSNEGSQRVKELRSALKKLPDDNAFLHELLGAVQPSKFYSGDIILNYSGAWMVVHFLLHGEDGRYADGFVRYIQAEVEGRAGPEVLYDALGTTAGELQEMIQSAVLMTSRLCSITTTVFPLVHQTVQHREQLADVVEVQAGGRLVEQVERAAGRPFSKAPWTA